MRKVPDIQKMKLAQEKIVMLTCYDYTSAALVNTSQIDILLVGDSAAMVMHGHASTIPATTEMLEYHVRAVANGAPQKLIVADMAFATYRQGLTIAMTAAARLIRAGAQAIKLEGATGNLELIEHMVGSGIPVMGHLGLTPQAVHTIGGYKVQAKQPAAIEKNY